MRFCNFLNIIVLSMLLIPRAYTRAALLDSWRSLAYLSFDTHSLMYVLMFTTTFSTRIKEIKRGIGISHTWYFLFERDNLQAFYFSCR